MIVPVILHKAGNYHNHCPVCLIRDPVRCRARRRGLDMSVAPQDTHDLASLAKFLVG